MATDSGGGCASELLEDEGDGGKEFTVTFVVTVLSKAAVRTDSLRDALRVASESDGKRSGSDDGVGSNSDGSSGSRSASNGEVPAEPQVRVTYDSFVLVGEVERNLCVNAGVEPEEFVLVKLAQSVIGREGWEECTGRLGSLADAGFASGEVQCALVPIGLVAS